MHKNIDSLASKHKFQQKLLNFQHISVSMFTNCVDFKVGLLNMAKF